jgi:hypothetical protein
MRGGLFRTGGSDRMAARPHSTRTTLTDGTTLSAVGRKTRPIRQTYRLPPSRRPNGPAGLHGSGRPARLSPARSRRGFLRPIRA